MVSPAGTGQAGISFNPESFTEGGGPPPPQNLLITYAEVKGNYQYTNRDGMPVGNPACVLELHTTGDDGDQRTQLYSAGPATSFTSSQDGTQIIPLGASRALSKQSNLGILLTELSGCGFPAEQFGSDLRAIFQGLYAFFDQKEQPQRPGLQQTPEQAARGPRYISVPTKIHNLPWDAATSPQASRIGQQSASGMGSPMGGPGSAPSAPAPTTPVAPVASAPVSSPPPVGIGADPATEALAVNTLASVAAANPANVTAKNLLIPAAFAAMGTDPNRQAAVNLINDDQWLSSHGYIADAAGSLTSTG